MIKINFKIETEYGTFSDAIHTPVELTEKQIETIKTERVNIWIAVVTAPRKEPEIVREE